MAIVATAGTTDFGSVDPLPEIASLAQGAGGVASCGCRVWRRIAFLGSLSRKGARNRGGGLAQRRLSQAVLAADPVQRFFCCATRRHFDSIKVHADYLNPELHEDEGIPNLVTTSLLTTRRFDALKLWISFQALGRTKLAAMIDRTIELAAQAAQIVRETPRLELICDPQLSTVVFRYVPSEPELDADRLTCRSPPVAVRSRTCRHRAHASARKRQCLKFTCMNPATQRIKWKA